MRLETPGEDGPPGPSGSSYLSPSPRRTSHLCAMRSTDSSSVRALNPTAGTHASACDSSLTLNRSCSACMRKRTSKWKWAGSRPRGRNPVYVDVEDGVVKRSHVEPGFFARLAQCDRKGIGVSVAVTTRLQPPPELAMGAQGARGRPPCPRSTPSP